MACDESLEEFLQEVIAGTGVEMQSSGVPLDDFPCLGSGQEPGTNNEPVWRVRTIMLRRRVVVLQLLRRRRETLARPRGIVQELSLKHGSSTHRWSDLRYLGKRASWLKRLEQLLCIIFP